MSIGNNAGQPGNGEPQEQAYDPMRARHEAAHAVIIDDLGYRVTMINIKPTFPQRTEAAWGKFGEARTTIDWDDPAQRDAIRSAVLGYVTVLVAGHLAENLINGTIERVSTRIQKAPHLFQTAPNADQAKADRDRTALYLFLVQRNKFEEVVAAEERALEILTRRETHLNALTKLLVEHGTIEGEIVDNALGKAPSDVNQS